ncbi:two-pore potassium channel 5-like [Phalaenopsis equestris]|uniref:two-pore potassium channel 5-like n=1 Tax=Phalaenopsis equestris TaxID=78828 RepID=UPI0009E5B6F1|nr:two-pore potassium channel 5-like [Phalaenopsis equestris]
MDEEDQLVLFSQPSSSEIEDSHPGTDDADGGNGAAASCSSKSPAHFAGRKSMLNRSKTAPTMDSLRNPCSEVNDAYSKKQPRFGPSIAVLKYAAALLLLYLSLGVLIYSTNSDGYSGTETHPTVDALYFCIVTLCTIGYGDIAPLTPMTKAISCIFVLVGFGILDVLLSAAVSYLLDLQESLILAAGARGEVAYAFDAEKGRMRIRMKVGIAVGVVVLCVGMGTVALHWVEHLDLIDSFYLAVMSVTTVGYGDRAFRTLKGRVFASFWLLVSTLAVARAFLYLVEARIDRRNRRIAKLVLQKGLTVEDLIAADINHNGFISKSEFVIYKLKEIGMIEEKDILLIINQFNKLDPNDTGKIIRPDLL